MAAGTTTGQGHSAQCDMMTGRALRVAHRRQATLAQCGKVGRALGYRRPTGYPRAQCGMTGRGMMAV